jgi:hypothetical protein
MTFKFPLHFWHSPQFRACANDNAGPTLAAIYEDRGTHPAQLWIDELRFNLWRTTHGESGCQDYFP